MSFSLDTKSEICGNYEMRPCCRKALLNSAFCFFSTVNQNKMQIKTASSATAFYLSLLTKEVFGISFALERNKDNCILSLTDPDEIRTLAEKSGLINPLTNTVQCTLDPNLSLDSCCQRAVIKGAFLTSGHIADPKKSYHFEIVSLRKRLLDQLGNIMLSMGIEPKSTMRQSKHLLYLKEKEQISDLLNILGATKMFFDFQEVTLEKEIKNSLNRKQNFEQANLDKTISVSVAQCNAIQSLMDSGKFETLEESLKEIALLRLENPEASLAELASLTQDKISRSGVNHRLKKLMELK